MSLLKLSELTIPDQIEQAPSHELLEFSGSVKAAAGDALAELAAMAVNIIPGDSLWYKSEGAWSNHQLLDAILAFTGPADVFFCTWAISEEAISRFIELKNCGAIRELHAVIDNGLRNRKPHIYQQAIAAFPSIKIDHCHAKATVIMNDAYQLVFMGSANYTRNPRIEVGTLVFDRGVAEANKHWIMQRINGTN